MIGKGTPATTPLPRAWPRRVKRATLHVISLAQFAMAYTRGWAADSPIARVRLQGQLDHSEQEVAWLREEMRIKDARMVRIDPRQRPYYAPTERLAILELRAARSWSLEQTANAFLITPATISSWMHRVDEQGPDALLRIPTAVNKFPDFVRYAVRRLKTLCPAMGKVKIAQILCRAGLHLGKTTIGRIMKEPPTPKPTDSGKAAKRVVASKRRNDVWHIDLTTVAIGSGFWTSWIPFALPQCWPFAWWVAIVEDHFSRRAMCIGVFVRKPNCRDMCAWFDRTIRDANATPKYIVCDRDPIFDCDEFREWVRSQGIKPPRYGAVGKHGSVAVVERLILTVKQLLAHVSIIPLRRESFRRELTNLQHWYNEHRPHTWLGGRTPNELYFHRRPANRRPRLEPRRQWPRGSPCARPITLVAGQPGDRLGIYVQFHAGRRHLPIVTLQRAA